MLLEPQKLTNRTHNKHGDSSSMGRAFADILRGREVFSVYRDGESSVVFASFPAEVDAITRDRCASTG